MAKYKGSVELISGLTQKNGGKFPLLDASAIQVDDNGTRLNQIIDDIKDGSAITQISYDNVTGKPQINGVELTGNKTAVELGIIDNTLAIENKAADAKVTGDKITALEGKAHTHENAEELAKIVAGKVAEWDAKETTDGSQAKATKALEDAKVYSDGLITKLVGTAPEALNTIEEIAAALKGDASVVDSLTEQITGKADKAHQHKLADITDFTVINTLESDSITDALSAAQGKALKASIDAIHTHANKAELDKIIEGKVEAWDGKAEAKHKHKLADISDMFTVENILTSESITNALSAAQGKALNDRLVVVETDKHTHANKGELDKVTDGKVAAWDAKAEANHTHELADVTDMFDVIDAVDNTSATDALSANQGKVLNEKIVGLEKTVQAVHTHANKEELDKISVGKVAEWDAKETVTGSQEKVDAGVQTAKAYTDERVNNLIVNPSKKITVADLALDDATQLYKATVKHDLNSNNLFVDAFNTTTKESELISFKVVDANNIEIYAEDNDSLDLLIIGEGTKIATLESGAIVDGTTAAQSTWSSQKINQEIEALKAQIKALQG